jgi:hypothetical protein
MDCVCPLPDEVTTILRVTCKENLGQVQRIGLQRAGFSFDANAAPTPNPITALASWEPLIIANDDTKLVITPYLENFVIPQPEALTRGGNDNTTINGVEEVMGYGGITVTANLSGVPTTILYQMVDLMCEPALVVYLFTQFGKIAALELDPVTNPGDEFTGLTIEANTFGVPDPGNNGFATFDEATMRFAFASGWSKFRKIITPAFNLKTQLQAPLA